MDVRTAIEEFILAAGADGLRKTSLRWYSSLLQRFSSEHGDREIITITVTDMRRYLVCLREQDYSEDIIHAHNRVLHRFWRWCALEYQMPNPMQNIKFPRQPKPKMPKAITVEDVIQHMNACGDDRLGTRNKAIIAFLADTGCRAAGVCGLLRRDLDVEQGRAYVFEKGGSAA